MHLLLIDLNSESPPPHPPPTRRHGALSRVISRFRCEIMNWLTL